MQTKLSVILLRGKNVSELSDMNKMSVHLEQLLTEKDRVDLKVRQNLTDPLLKSADFIVLCGYDAGLLSEFFKIVSYIESLNGSEKKPYIFLYEEPGQSINSTINDLFMQGSGMGRMDVKVLDNIVDTWTYNDIIGYINIHVKRLGSAGNTQRTKSVSSGDLLTEGDSTDPS